METQADIAERIARKAHQGQRDKQGADYILHVERVALAVPGDIPKAIAWLHDVLEDTAETPASLKGAGASDRVILGVQRLTNTVWLESYALYIEWVAICGDAAAISVKLADLRDNLRPGPLELEPLRERYRKAIVRLERAPRFPDVCESCGQWHWTFVGCFT